VRARLMTNDVLSAIDHFLAGLQKQFQHMPIMGARALLEVSRYDFRNAAQGDEADLISIGELAAFLRCPLPAATRLVGMLSTGNPDLGPPGGLKLIQVFRDGENHRVKRLRLTGKGRKAVVFLHFTLTTQEHHR
jgi:DNA-binding MarR family transcriptional regulator